MQYTKDRFNLHKNALYVLYKAINMDKPSVQILIDIDHNKVCDSLQNIAYNPNIIHQSALKVKGRYKWLYRWRTKENN